jgi:murein L,D-transpeptidase YafK
LTNINAAIPPVGDKALEEREPPMPVGDPCRKLAAGLALLALVAAAPASATDGREKADLVLVLKAARRLLLLRDGAILASYPIALGRHPRGPKQRRGDGRTPEGDYIIDRRFTDTPYHLALHISYPSAADARRARAHGASPGGDILIHGMPGRFGHTDPARFFHDWTNGCIAVGNVAVEEIWNAVDDGTPIEIRP